MSKILNQVQGYRVNQETANKVLQVARDLGYDFNQLHKIKDKRRAPRLKTDLNIVFSIHLEDDLHYDSGTARLGDISILGALLADFKPDKGHLPVSPFIIHLTIQDPGFKRFILKAECVRLQNNGHMDLGVQFVDLNQTTKDALKAYWEHLAGIEKQMVRV